MAWLPKAYVAYIENNKDVETAGLQIAMVCNVERCCLCFQKYVAWSYAEMSIPVVGWCLIEKVE